MSLTDIEKQAMLELAEEEFRQRVEEVKATIREKRSRSFWRNLFPYKITIERIK